MTELIFAGERFVARADRTLFHPSSRTLFLSDLHLGKARVFQTAGIPVTDASEQQDLARLDRALEDTRASHLWILGDLFHQVAGIQSQQIQTWSTHLQAHTDTAQVILGNHDRAGHTYATQLGLTICPEPSQWHGIQLAHHPDPDRKMPRIAGHIHPQVQFKTAADRLVYPCFAIPHQHELLLPAFTGFSGGPRFEAKQTACYAITPIGVLPPDKIPPRT
jgi:DNA ligase-associated metallophosphoesterase